MRSTRVWVSLFAAFCLPLVMHAAPKVVRRTPGTIAFSTAPGMIHSMDAANTLYSSIQITNGTITALSNDPVSKPVPLPPGAAIYPGFIDSHSHAISLLTAQATNSTGQPYWLSLANVNVMQLPNCASGTPVGSVTCFTPMTTQAQVESILSQAKANSAGWILGWNYEPSRMTCTVNGVQQYGFQCPSFANQNQQTVLAMMDKINSSAPMMVTSESGHIVYVNSKAFNKLKICGPTGLANCYMPIYNTSTEIALAYTGQLDEDLALYAISTIEGILASDYASPAKTKNEKAAKWLDFYAKQIDSALLLYSSLGYTTVQEGAASASLIDIYMAAVAAMAAQKPPRYLPATMAFLQYDGKTSSLFANSVASAQKLQASLSKNKLDMFIAGMKLYADGSNQGYTGDMSAGLYQNLNKPYTDPEIFPKQPYSGLADDTQADLTSAAQAAHHAGFPLWVHTNGTDAQTSVLGALTAQKSNTLRDVVVHFTTPTETQMDNNVPVNNIGATFLVNDFYYYYQPLCEQVLTPAATANLYPALWAQQNNVHFGLHSDASITPPSPLFAMWIATNRPYQQASWLPPLSANCAGGLQNQKIPILQAMRAFTSDAAWLYGRETTTPATGPGRGSLQPGFAGDLVILSSDPLAPNADLSKIYVLYTVHNGNIVYPTSGTGWATSGPPWPN